MFNDTTSAAFLWCIAQIMNAVDDTLLAIGTGLAGRERLTSVHANRFVLYYVFTKLKGQALDDTVDVTELTKQAESITKECLDKLNTKIAEHFSDAYPGNIFKNQERQAELLKFIEA